MVAAEEKGLSTLVGKARIQRQQEKERYERKQTELHWNCHFFRHCWNEGLKLPTRYDCPECSNQYWEFRQSQTNHRSIHTQDTYHHNNMDQRLKIKVLMLGLENELLTKSGLIMKKKATKGNMFGRKANGVQEA